MHINLSTDEIGPKCRAVIQALGDRPLTIAPRIGRRPDFYVTLDAERFIGLDFDRDEITFDGDTFGPISADEAVALLWKPR